MYALELWGRNVRDLALKDVGQRDSRDLKYNDKDWFSAYKGKVKHLYRSRGKCHLYHCYAGVVLAMARRTFGKGNHEAMLQNSLAPAFSAKL